MHWRRRPYESHAYPHCSSDAVSGGVTNPRFAVELPPQSPTKPIEDLDFDPKPSATYQSLTNLPRSTDPTQYITMYKGNESGQRSSSKSKKCTAALWFVAILALVAGCAGVALASYNWASDSDGDKGECDNMVSELQTQLTASKAVVDKLTSMVEELQENFTKVVVARDIEIEQLSHHLGQINRSVSEILTPTDSPATAEPAAPQTVNLSRNCEYELVDRCRILDTQLTPVEGADADSYPNFSSCFTPSVTTMSGTSIQDIYCAVTNFRDERNPVIATLKHDIDTDSISCYCFVTALETRRGIVDCSMFLRRCPSVVQVN